MAIKLASAVVDALLFGPEGRRRQLQDFPILGDVWTKFASEPGAIQDLLVIPTWERPTGDVVALISLNHAGEPEHGCSVAYLQNLVVASFDLCHLCKVIIPATCWWDQIQDSFEEEPPRHDQLARWIRVELAHAIAKRDSSLVAPADVEGAASPAGDELLESLGVTKEELEDYESLTTSERQAAKLGLALGVFITAAEYHDEREITEPLPDLREAVRALTTYDIIRSGTFAVGAIIERHQAFSSDLNDEWNGVIFQVTLNREAEAAVTESVPAIKADAARSLFSISCHEIGWAVLDSGIDYSHPAFVNHDPKTHKKRPHRIKGAFDFKRIRAILGVKKNEIVSLANEIFKQSRLKPTEISDLLTEVMADREKRRPLDWRKIRQLIEIDILGDPAKVEAPKGEKPTHPHGTHVAGIIGADWREDVGSEQRKLTGICPDIKLYDMRVIGSSLGDSEFAVTAALQFIRFLNEQSGARIDGINMSLAIRHNVRNYACGRTPVCLESEALVANGVVVVAAAGNRGYQSFQLADASTFESYAASSITDPGNAENVITVGSTHRQWPHTYGVSFFSSRGPTGDGRLKPDLLAPGEKILSCIPGGRDDRMDGTSMAAPHVSGAAALLMGRHQELKGQPAQIKHILCSTATDLNRERSFQGHGMVDVLRAIQSR